MAQTAVIEEQREHVLDAEDDEQQQQQQRSPGRPKGSKTKDNGIEPQDFWDQCVAFTDAEWDKLVIYVWRRDPFFDNTNGAREPKYIGVENRRLNEQMLLEEHGSGTYKLFLNRGDKKLNYTIVTVLNPKYPPHLPPGDWLKHPRNKHWIEWKPLIDSWWKETTKSLTGDNGERPEPGLPLSVAQAISDIRSEIKSGRSNDDKVASSVFGILPNLLEQARNPPKSVIEPILLKMLDKPAGPDPVLTKMYEQANEDRKRAEDQRREDLQRMDDQRRKDAEIARAEVSDLRKQNSDLLQTMLNRANTPPAENMAQQFEGYAKAISTITELAHSAAPAVAPGEWWQEALKSLFQNAGPMLGPLFARMAMPPTPRPLQFPQQPAQIPTALPPAASPPATPVQATVASDPNQPQMDSMMLGMMVQIAQWAANDLSLGRDGGQLADSVVYKLGEGTYRQIVTNVPKEQLVELLKRVPEAWQFVAPFEAALPQFLDEFYGLLEELNAPSEEVHEPPVTVMPRMREPANKIVQPLKKAKKK